MKRTVTTSPRAATAKTRGLITAIFAVATVILVAAFARPGAGTGQNDSAGSRPGVLQAAVAKAEGKDGSAPKQAPKPFKIYHNGSISYPAVGALVSPAPQNARVPMSQTRVVTALKTTKLAPQDLEGLQPSSVRLVSYENQLGKTSPRGGMIPSVPRQLAWFVEYDNVKHAISVPATWHGKWHSAVTSNPWVSVVVISAQTGAVIDAFDYSV